jgi:DNA-binding response OmpR family regulator
MMGTKTILIIEDDDETRAWFGTALSKAGYEVALASTGQGGLEYLQTSDPPDLITLDMFMPGMDGWQFLRYREHRWHSVPVLITTGLKIGTDEWAESLAACGCLRKPIDCEELLAQVRKRFEPPASRSARSAEKR